MGVKMKEIPTDELVKELVSREGVRVIDIGTYANYELRPKYGADSITDRKVIVLPLEMTLNV